MFYDLINYFKIISNELNKINGYNQIETSKISQDVDSFYQKYLKISLK